jgi:molybdenum cofactor guanylyltransferase
MADVLGVILVGGRSRRFGSEKALAQVGGLTIVERVLAVHTAVFGKNVVLVGDRGHLFGELDVTTVPDLLAGAGPIGGVHAGLKWAESHWCRGIVCTPCDAPFVSRRLLVALADYRESAVVVPRSAGPLGYEPLFGWYSVELIRLIEQSIHRGELALHELVKRADRVTFLDPDKIGLTGDPDMAFLNVNTPADLERARAYLGEVDGEG